MVRRIRFWLIEGAFYQFGVTFTKIIKDETAALLERILEARDVLKEQISLLSSREGAFYQFGLKLEGLLTAQSAEIGGRITDARDDLKEEIIGAFYRLNNNLNRLFTQQTAELRDQAIASTFRLRLT